MIQIAKMSDLPTLKNMPIPNETNAQNFLWVGNKHIILWNFLEAVQILSINEDNMKESKLTKLEEI